jgi:hypothetical protein
VVVQDLAQPRPVALHRWVFGDRQHLRERDEAARQAPTAGREQRERRARPHVAQQVLRLVLQDHGLGGDPSQERELVVPDLRERRLVLVEDHRGHVVQLGMAAPEHR